jgi:hypothetical protein
MLFRLSGLALFVALPIQTLLMLAAAYHVYLPTYNSKATMPYSRWDSIDRCTARTGACGSDRFD